MQIVRGALAQRFSFHYWLFAAFWTSRHGEQVGTGGICATHLLLAIHRVLPPPLPTAEEHEVCEQGLPCW